MEKEEIKYDFSKWFKPSAKFLDLKRYFSSLAASKKAEEKGEFEESQRIADNGKEAFIADCLLDNKTMQQFWDKCEEDLEFWGYSQAFLFSEEYIKKKK